MDFSQGYLETCEDINFIFAVKNEELQISCHVCLGKMSNERKGFGVN